MHYLNELLEFGCMFSLGLKGKIILFSVLCIPFLIIEVLFSYFSWIPHNHWIVNTYFLRIWFYIIFLSFIFIPFSEIILFKEGRFFQRILLIFTFLFLGVDIIYYSGGIIDINQIFATFMFIIFLNFSFTSSIFSKFDLIKYGIFNIILIVIGSVLLALNLFDILYIYINIFYVMFIFSIIFYLFNSRKQFTESDT
jgi:hypothetical protein